MIKITKLSSRMTISQTIPKHQQIRGFVIMKRCLWDDRMNKIYKMIEVTGLILIPPHSEHSVNSVKIVGLLNLLMRLP